MDIISHRCKKLLRPHSYTIIDLAMTLIEYCLFANQELGKVGTKQVALMPFFLIMYYVHMTGLFTFVSIIMSFQV